MNKVNGLDDVYQNKTALSQDLQSTVFSLPDISLNDPTISDAKENLQGELLKFKGFLEIQNQEISLQNIKSLASLSIVIEASSSEATNQESTKGKLTITQTAKKADSVVTIDSFEIVKTRATGKSSKKKFTKASGQSAGNPLMTLDFFEGSAVGASQGQDSPHTRQLKEFVFIQQQNAQGDHQWWKKEVNLDFGLSKDELRRMQDSKPKKAAGKASKAAQGHDLLDLDQESPMQVEKTQTKNGGDTQLDDIFSSMMAAPTDSADMNKPPLKAGLDGIIAAAQATGED